MKKNLQGIQIIGTQRSGSNLLRVMLEQSSEITALHPPHILQNFVPLMKYYDTSRIEEYHQLVEHVTDFIRNNPVPWEGIEFSAETISAQAKTRTIFELFKIIYEEAARQRGSKYWCCKSMVNFKYFREFEVEGIRPKYIYLHRDGRDVALSFKKAVVGEKHIYHLAHQWRNDQLACLDLIKQLGADRCFVLGYEDFIADPGRAIRAICSFLGIEFKLSMLEYHTSNESKVTASSGAMWANLTKPVITSNKGKFLTELTQTELEIFEMVAGDALIELGYPIYSGRTKNQLTSENAVAQYHLENEQLKANIQKANANDFMSRNGQRHILEAVKNRSTPSQIIL